MKTNRFGFLTAVMALALCPAVYGQAAGTMPVAQQNGLVQKYCAVCHADAFPNGRLSLEHFDAAHADPGVAAMMASKLRAKALGASGQALPDRATQDALLSALLAEAAGSNAWVVKDAAEVVTQWPTVTASMVQEVPGGGGDPDLYRLIVTCNGNTREAGMELAWSPGVPRSGQTMSVAVDGEKIFEYAVEGNEKMGNGQGGTSGPGAAVLYATRNSSGGMPATMPLPKQTLTVEGLFPGETVVFRFGGLKPEARKSLSACFAEASARR